MTLLEKKLQVKSIARMDGDNEASGGGVPFEEDDDFKHRYGFQRIRDNDPLLMIFRLSGDHENNE